MNAATITEAPEVLPLLQALLWTDGRYHLQASQQLGAGWTLMKAGKPSVPTIKSFLAKRLHKESRVGIDPFVHSGTFVNDLEEVRVICRHHTRNVTLLQLDFLQVSCCE